MSPRPPPHLQALVYVRQLAEEAGQDGDAVLIGALVFSDLADVTLMDAARLIIERKAVTP